MAQCAVATNIGVLKMVENSKLSVGLSSFFGDDASILHDLQAASTNKNYREGAMIVGEGDSGSTVFYLLSGTASALRYSAAGAEVFIDTFGPGDLIGEMSVLGGGERTADLYATSDVELTTFSGPAFISLMEKHGNIGLRVSRLLVTRVRRTTRRMFEQSTLSSKGRVCAELMRLAEPVGSTDVLQVSAMPSISEIAKKLGLARETVSRTVSELKDQAVVASDGSNLLINQPHLLLARLG